MLMVHSSQLAPAEGVAEGDGNSRVQEHGFLSILLLYVPDSRQSKQRRHFFTFDAIPWKDSSQSYKLL
jgi:hypothetical protein